MKLFDGIHDWWQAASAFFTNAFDAVVFGVQKVRQGISWIVTNRVALVASVVAVCKGIYDFIVSQINSALASFQSLSFDAVSGGSVGEFLAFGNCIFPISETFAWCIALLEFWLACALIKLVLRFVPFV